MFLGNPDFTSAEEQNRIFAAIALPGLLKLQAAIPPFNYHNLKAPTG